MKTNIIRDPDAKENTGAQTTQAGNEQPAPVPPKGQATDEQVKEWKARHKQGIFSLVIPNDDGGNSIVYFKRPGRNELNYSKTRRDPNAPDEQFRALAEVLHIGGDESLFKDEQAMISICYYMENMDVGKPMMVLNH